MEQEKKKNLRYRLLIAAIIPSVTMQSHTMWLGHLSTTLCYAPYGTYPPWFRGLGPLWDRYMLSTFILPVLRRLTEGDLEHKRMLLKKLGFAFFLFGLINNGELLTNLNFIGFLWNVYAVLYVIILSAALDLVPPSTPKGIIAFCNIAPALVAKVGWPYFLKGRIRYTKRLIGCCVMSFLGMIVSWRAMSFESKANWSYFVFCLRLSPFSTICTCGWSVSVWRLFLQARIWHTVMRLGADSGFRPGRINFSPTFNNLFAFINCWSQCWVMIS